MINRNHAKGDFRKSCISKLRCINRLTKIKKEKIIVKKLQEIIKELNAKKILIYIPLEIEVNVIPLIKELRKQKKEVYVPFMCGDSFKAVKYRLPIEKKRFGIKEPKNSFLKVKIDLAIVPIVGIDKLYKRIGFGKGMYDRFFYRLPYRPTVIFTQLELCKSDLILSNQYDIQADYIITS
ncbi:MAG: 5-formyltetrahydrofolate cyclo-ligase [Arcobacteraceae bacterium]